MIENIEHIVIVRKLHVKSKTTPLQTKSKSPLRSNNPKNTQISSNIPLLNSPSNLRSSLNIHKKKLSPSHSQNPSASTNITDKATVSIFKLISDLNSQSATPLKSLKQFDNDLKDYQIQLYRRKSKTRSSIEYDECNQKLNQLKEAFIEAMTSSRITDNKMHRENIKNEVLSLILSGGGDKIKTIKSLDELFKYNPDRDKIKPEEPQYIFNTMLDNGKNLFYMACQEGKLEIVKYFVTNGLNAKLKSKVEQNINEYESPLECACRWNYVNIVKYLIKNVEYTDKEIEACLQIKDLSQTIVQLLKQQLMKYNKKIWFVCC